MSAAASKLGYGIPRDTSVVVNRTTKTYQFLHSTYQPGDIATCTFPTGTDYVDTHRSFLVFEFNNEDDAKSPEEMLFGVHGSACNVIRDIAVYARSGEELCRIEDFNLLQNMVLPLKYDRDWFTHQGGGMWYGDRIYANSQSCLIPMYILSPLFNTRRLLPAALVSGMRIEITLDDAAKVTYGYDTQAIQPVDATNYSISSARFGLETVKLSDGIRRAMDEIISTNGIELVYTGWHHEWLEPGHGMIGETNMTIKGTFARALRAFARLRPRENGTELNSIHPEGQRDSFRGECVYPYNKHQWRLGERYYPDTPFLFTRPVLESYTHVLNAYQRFSGHTKRASLPLLRDNSLDGISDAVMRGDQSSGESLLYPGIMASTVGHLGSYFKDSHVLGLDITRDDNNGISGRPINNVEPLTLSFSARSFSFELLYNSLDTLVTGTVLRRMDVFLEYVKLVRVFTDNVEVEK